MADAEDASDRSGRAALPPSGAGESGAGESGDSPLARLKRRLAKLVSDDDPNIYPLY